MITAVGFLIGRHTDLATLIQLLTTVVVIVQALAQIIALTVPRRRRPDLPRGSHDRQARLRPAGRAVRPQVAAGDRAGLPQAPWLVPSR